MKTLPDKNTVFIKHEDDSRLEAIYDRLRGPERAKVQRLVMNEKYSLLKALEAVGILVAIK